MEENNYSKIKHRTFEIIQVGEKRDFISRSFDFLLIFLIGLNGVLLLLETFPLSEKSLHIIKIIEYASTFLFTVEYLLRLWTSDLLYSRNSRMESFLDFVKSPFGIIDLLAILPYYIPAVLPTGFVVLRALRAVRILRLFRINKYYDSLEVISRVMKKKRTQLFSSLFIIIIMMMTSSILMFHVEHRAQPEVFDNVFTSMWFIVANISTIGFGDIYPITVLGRVLSIIITFLGVGLVAIPTGIISAGFIEQIGEAKRVEERERRRAQGEKHYCPYCGKKLD